MRVWLLACITSVVATVVAYQRDDGVAVLIFLVILAVAAINVIGRTER